MKEKLAKTRITSTDGYDNAVVTIGRSAVPSAPRLPMAPRQSSKIGGLNKTAVVTPHAKRTTERLKSSSNATKPSLHRSSSSQKKRSDQRPSLQKA